MVRAPVGRRRDVGGARRGGGSKVRGRLTFSICTNSEALSGPPARRTKLSPYVPREMEREEIQTEPGN